MAKVLIIEDNESKAEIIASIISSIKIAELSFAKTISGAYSELDHSRWDLVVLDMTFQVSQGLGQTTRKEALAGVEVLQFMMSKELFYPVIVATQHSYFAQSGLINLASVNQLHELLSTTFPKIYRGIVRADLTTIAWHSELLRVSRRILNVQEAKNSRRRRLIREI